ncbi:hypothetical protein FOZ63_026722 [Perkinsus olseni]|uniref:Thymus-specific serine protease n=1 Tax=Perkinsus olseni TaxID=32597 RepID=A0A7J6S7N2_PEROL|nr:hypothetical protein FOZ62_001315 [Perkinsus olseni]KAF4728522.1 hypothetical protein FOZ63_026722 [Perkinsus olseni]
MLVVLLSTLASLVATVHGHPYGRGDSPLFSHNRSLNVGGGVLCPDAIGKQEYGYIQVGPLNKYFYASVEADMNPGTPSTVLFFGGGPGDSSIATAMSLSGPCRMTPDGKKLMKNEYSWTRQANVVWVDAPGPTGFSVGPVEADLNKFINNMLAFVTQFFKKHPNLNTNVHLVGVSSSALVVTMLGERIVNSPGSKVDLKGVMMYSGVVGPYDMYYGCFKMAKGRKLLPQAELDTMLSDLRKCDEEVQKCNSKGPGKPPLPRMLIAMPWKPARRRRFVLSRKPKSASELVEVLKTGMRPWGYDVRVSPGQEYQHYAFQPGRADCFLNTPAVQKELGVSKHWEPSNDQVFQAFNKYTAYKGVYHTTQLLDSKLKVLVVNGDQDYLTNAVGTTEWLFKLHGIENYGSMLGQVTPVPLKDAKGRPFGNIQALKYGNAARLAFLEVTGGSHRLVLNEPVGMQQTLWAFLDGGLW